MSSTATTGPHPLDSTRRHLSGSRAAMAELFGGHMEHSSTGTVLTTAGGEEFLNCAGYGVFFTGACHPRITEAVVEQVRRHPLSSRILLEPLAAEAARTLAGVCPPGLVKVHFTNSGTEAVETAIKLGRAAGARRLITTVNGYHGKTLGALSVTARPFYQQPFQPLLPDVVQVPFGDTDALGEALVQGPRSCFIVEPIQGEGGVILPPPGYLSEVERLCRQHGAFLIVDEILPRSAHGPTGSAGHVRDTAIRMSNAAPATGGPRPVRACRPSPRSHAPTTATTTASRSAT